VIEFSFLVHGVNMNMNVNMNMHTNMTIGDYRVDAVVVSVNRKIATHRKGSFCDSSDCSHILFSRLKG
jgi:hypothetical protein